MNQRKILLLENVASQAAAVRDHLSRAGFQVAVSRYEADGLRRLAEWGPDLVLVSTAHPAGDFVEYCRHARALAPAARFVVTSPLNRERLLRELPGLQAVVPEIITRPYSHEEVAALLAADPVTPSAPVAAPAVMPDGAGLRAEFQRQLEEKFLEVEVLKRRLEVADRRVASTPGLEWLQSENDHLRQATQEAGKKSALALATEQLKRSELEVKLDNLLRMKEEFEFRTQNEIELRTHEAETLRGQLLEVREGADRARAEHEALRDGMERVLVEKEQIEEKLHALESGGQQQGAPTVASPGDAARVSALEDELNRYRAQAAEAQAALADATAQAAVLEESSTREQAAREGLASELVREREGRAGTARQAQEERERHAAQTRELREQAAAAQQQLAQCQSTHAALQQRVSAAEAAAADAQAALVAATDGRVALEKELAGAQEACGTAARLEQEQRTEVAAQRQRLLERAECAERRSEQLQSACTGLEERLGASEAARISVAAEAEAVVGQADARVTSLAAELERERAARAEAERRAADLSLRLESAERLAADAAALRTRVTELDVELERLRGSEAAEALLDAAVGDAQRLGRELAAAGDRARDLTTERNGLQRLLEEREERLDREVRIWSEKTEAAGRELELLRSHQAQSARGREEELRTSAERLEKAGRELEESELRVVALRSELAAAANAHDRETRLLGERAAAAAREAGGRLERAEAALIAEREGAQAREREARLQLESQQSLTRESEKKPTAKAIPEDGAQSVREELHRIQELLEEVISRARTDAVDHARRDAELSFRLQAALDERQRLQERYERASAEATERERRSASLLQSAIDRGPSQASGRDNLPAVVPPDSAPPQPRRTAVLAGLAGLAVVALAVLLAFVGLRRTTAPPDRAPHPAAPRPQHEPAPAAGVTPGAVWDRWTRSDSSGGVLVQATLLSEEELRAEVEAEQRSRGWTAAQAQAELTRRLGTFRFDTAYYVTVYLKNLAPGYPPYLDDLASRFRLRDGTGREAPAFVPAGHEKDRRVFTFGAGAPSELIYEATVPLGFSRAGLSPSSGYLQLVVSDVGTASRRVLTWELE